MKLREALLEKKRVKVGSGTAFVYCGPVDLKRIEKHSADELAILKNKLKEATDFVNNYPQWKDPFIMNTVIKLLRRQLNAIKHGNDVPIKTAMQVLNEAGKTAEEEAAKRLERNVRQIDALTEKITKWVGFLDREVLECYKSIVDPDVDIIIFDGTEEGDYWDEEEYVKANGPFEEVQR